MWAVKILSCQCGSASLVYTSTFVPFAVRFSSQKEDKNTV